MKRKNGTLLPDDNDNALMVALLFIFFCVTCMVLSVVFVRGGACLPWLHLRGCIRAGEPCPYS